MLTVSPEIREAMNDMASLIVSELGIKGTSNIQFGYESSSGRLVVLEVNPRYSRSSAFASVATGINIAEVMTKCAAGIVLNAQGLSDIAAPEKITVRIPVFQFEKFPGADTALNTRMQSVGAIAATGATFKDAMKDALSQLECMSGKKYDELELNDILSLLRVPSGDRYELIAKALELKADIKEISQATGIDAIFIEQIKDIMKDPAQVSNISLIPAEKGPVLVLMSGPAKIGQAQELSVMGAQIMAGLHKIGIEAIAADSNLYGMACIPGKSMKTEITPLDANSISKLCLKHKTLGIIWQTGGAIAMETAADLEKAGMKSMGTSAETACFAESREGLAVMAQKTGVKIPQAGFASNLEEAIRAAENIGFPVIVLPQTEAPDGSGNQIAGDAPMLEECLAGVRYPVYIEKFLEGGFMAQVDALCDGTDAFIPAITEHIEHAGIHTGDAGCVVPPVNINEYEAEQICGSVKKIAAYFKPQGFLNAQFAVLSGEIYCIGVSLRASRTVQLVSKVTGTDMTGYALQAMLGKKISEMCIVPESVPEHYGVREAVFSFDVFEGADPLLGPEMRSTGQSLGIAGTFGLAFARAMEASGVKLPEKGSVLMTVSRNDRQRALEIARMLDKSGFEICATKGTAVFLNDNGIKAISVLKLYEGRPNIVDNIKNGSYCLVINTPSGRLSRHDDSYIRKAAIKYGIPYATTIAGANAMLKAITAKAS
jgi:carbamoyl-phosphate synthase large subunit